MGKLCESYFSACEGNDEKPREPSWPKWAPYVEFFGRVYKDVDRYAFKETAPYTWFELPELKVAVAGLDSTMREEGEVTKGGGLLFFVPKTERRR